MTFLRLSAVLDRVGMRHSAWYARVADGRAPRPIRLSSRLAVWTSSSIDEWLDSVIRRGEPAPGTYGPSREEPPT